MLVLLFSNTFPKLRIAIFQRLHDSCFSFCPMSHSILCPGCSVLPRIHQYQTVTPSHIGKNYFYLLLYWYLFLICQISYYVQSRYLVSTTHVRCASFFTSNETILMYTFCINIYCICFKLCFLGLFMSIIRSLTHSVLSMILILFCTTTLGYRLCATIVQPGKIISSNIKLAYLQMEQSLPM